MRLYVDVSYESLNKYNEELCGDTVEVIRNGNSVTVVLADGLGSGVKANILSTLTSKIIGTMLVNGASIDEAVETIANTLPVCKEREIAYSTFSILQVFNSGECYLVEFDNPSVIYLEGGKVKYLESISREINGKHVKESRLQLSEDDTFVLISDGVVHAGIGSTLNLGWQWENVAEYVERTWKKDLSAKKIAKLLVSVCDNLYAQKPGDDATVAAVKIRSPLKVNIMVGPPVDRNQDNYVVSRFLSQEGMKVVCGGTTSKIVSRETGREIVTSFNYFNPAVPPIAEIDGIDLTTEGVLTLGKTLDYVRRCLSTESTIHDLLHLKDRDGASKLANILLEDGTSVNFFVGRAMNPAHQNPDMPLNLGLKLKLVEELAAYLKSIGKEVSIEYF
ncbi:MAG TPA: SpoIIE family protein phosphatase [Clostridiales bacterium]|mgnify:CR=1 FL=1|nr:SpoIIE family protein phosphatase [Clostridiales bacterium]